MQWVIDHLKSALRREKMFGTKHTPLKADKKYNASATFSEQRIPQLKKAIEILSTPQHTPTPKAKPKKKSVTNQLKIFK
jgi:hypothetical protein